MGGGDGVQLKDTSKGHVWHHRDQTWDFSSSDGRFCQPSLNRLIVMQKEGLQALDSNDCTSEALIK